jgi:hypothetical protein
VNALDAAYQRNRREIASKVADAVEQAWKNNLDGGRDVFIKQAVMLVQGGMQATAVLLSAYFTTKARISSGNSTLRPTVIPARELTVEALRGVPADEVYGRPFGALGFQLAQGAEFDAAAETGQSYARKLAMTDLQLASTHATKRWIEAHNG